MFPSLLLIHSLALPVIRAVTEQCLQGPPRGLPVWHIRFTTTHLSPHPPFPSPLCFGQITAEAIEKHSSPLSQLFLSIPTPPLSTSPTSCCTSPSYGRPVGGPVLSLRSNGARFTPEGVLLAWRRAPRFFDHQTETRSFNTDEVPPACLPACCARRDKTAKDVAAIVV